MRTLHAWMWGPQVVSCRGELGICLGEGLGCSPCSCNPTPGHPGRPAWHLHLSSSGGLKVWQIAL